MVVHLWQVIVVHLATMERKSTVLTETTRMCILALRLQLEFVEGWISCIECIVSYM